MKNFVNKIKAHIATIYQDNMEAVLLLLAIETVIIFLTIIL